MLKEQILEDLKKTIKQLGYQTTDIVCTIPKNSSFGDYSTNLALQLAKLQGVNNKQSPQEIANEILGKFGNPDYLEKVEIAGGGFINFFIKDETLLRMEFDKLPLQDKPLKIFIEYGHTNLLKEVHIGHLRTFILGESLARILESAGNKVFRANYQGDIGLHIAKAIWGIKKMGLPSKDLSLTDKADYMGDAYARGNKLYEQDPEVKKEIDRINIALYKKDEEFKYTYQQVREWSLDYFQPIYELLGIKYDRCFFESEVYERGREIVLENLNKVFEESDGAVIFPGEKYGLHNRVFITSAGNPTYEGKEMGLAELEYSEFEYDKAIHVVAHEQAGYFQVVFKAIEMVFPNLLDKKYHLSYGLVDLKEGKMSSRTGTVITVDDLYKVVSKKVKEVMKQNRGEKDPVDPSSIDQDVVKQIAMGAIKFSYLKFSPTPNMVFDLEESVSLEGDSGPYVQYAYARIQSVLKNTREGTKSIDLDSIRVNVKLEKQERLLLRQLVYFPDIVSEVAISYHPNLLTTYLIELARHYNLFYQECRIIGSEKEQFRLKLSEEVGKILKYGLDLLGIEAPERM